jgi:hypothetical protein
MTCGTCRELITPWGDGWRHVYGDHDDHDAVPDPSRDGTRCVYGYWTAPEE